MDRALGEKFRVPLWMVPTLVCWLPVSPQGVEEAAADSPEAATDKPVAVPAKQAARPAYSQGSLKPSRAGSMHGSGRLPAVA